MKIPILRIPYTDEEIKTIKDEIEKILRSGHLTMADNVARFEEAFARFTGVKYAVGVNSGTSALEIILRAINVQGASVVVPTNTFMATPVSVIHAGGKVIFTDVTREDLCMDPDDLQKKIRKDTKAVIVVHIGGTISPYIYDIKKICDDKGLFLIEDAAHAHGSTIYGVQAGTIGIASAFSFYPTKVFTCAEGGMITTNDESIYQKALILREHGKTDHRINVHHEFGYNWRLSELHAVLGLQQMKKADYIINERRRIAKSYDEKLKAAEGIRCVMIPDYIKSSYYKYIAYLEEGIEREIVKQRLLNEYNVSLTGEVYSDLCHAQPVFKKYRGTMLNSNEDTFPQAEYVSSKQICLPLYPGLKEEEIDYVVDSLRSVLHDCLVASAS